jgi:hypothetical protein
MMRTTATATDRDGSFWETLRCPGLTTNHPPLKRILGLLQKEMAVFTHKYSHPLGLLWVVFVGGTGTGKSTCFNALCGEMVSAVGVERPKTGGPILYLHQRWLDAVQKQFPFPLQKVERPPTAGALFDSVSGVANRVLAVVHDREHLAPLVLVDTPDLDSVEAQNRQMAEDLYLFADAVVFVSSHEKYADQVPYQFLKRIHEEGKLTFFLLNKAEPLLTRDEVLRTLRDQDLNLTRERFYLLPATSREPVQFLEKHPEFATFVGQFEYLLATPGVGRLGDAERKRFSQAIAAKTDQVLRVLQEEEQAAQHWLELLDGLLEKASRQLLEQQQSHFDEESRRYLQIEIRKIFAKYDLLAKPRRLLSQILLSPLRFLGLLQDQPTDSHHVALQRLHRKIDLHPIQAAIEAFNRQVLEHLSPPDEAAPLFAAMRQPSVPLKTEDIKKTVWEQQDRLARWLEETFQRMARGIPRSTRWGIYSTSIAWGILIVLLETMVGGGISLTEALLDSALAPFLTKGAVELFAHGELQKVIRELGQHYEQSQVAVLHQQRARYAELLTELGTPTETLAALQARRDELLTAGR